MKLFNKLLPLTLLFAILSCEENCCQMEYHQLAKGDQIPYLLSKYELRNNVVVMEKTEFNTYKDTTILNQFATSYYKFENHYLKSFTEEKLNGGRYLSTKTESRWSDNKLHPIVYTYYRNGKKQYVDSLVYDSQDRMHKAYSLQGTLQLNYNDNNQLTKKQYAENGNIRWSRTYNYDGKDLESDEFYNHKNGTANMTLRDTYDEDAQKTFRVTNGKEELSTTKTLNDYGDVLVSEGKYGITRNLSYIYDKNFNWVLRIDKAKRGIRYITRRTITYKNGDVTGNEWTPEKIAKTYNLTYDVNAFETYKKTVKSYAQQ